jgi:hypothetical protein
LSNIIYYLASLRCKYRNEKHSLLDPSSSTLYLVRQQPHPGDADPTWLEPCKCYYQMLGHPYISDALGKLLTCSDKTKQICYSTNNLLFGRELPDVFIPLLRNISCSTEFIRHISKKMNPNVYSLQVSRI